MTRRKPRCNVPILRAMRTLHCQRTVSEAGRRCWQHPVVGS